MGRNKALIQIQGRPLIERLLDCASRLTNEVYISSDDVESYRFLDFPVVPDLYAGQGPLAGLHSVMKRTKRPLVLVLACDLPSVTEPFLRRLVGHVAGFDAVIPRTPDGQIHGACGVYRRTWLPFLEESLARGQNQVRRLLGAAPLAVKWLGPSEGGFTPEDLVNINSPEDLGRHTDPCDYI